MKRYSIVTSIFVALLFVGVVGLPESASAVTPSRLITVRSDEDRLLVKQMGLDIVHRSADGDEILDGSITTIQVEAAVTINFVSTVTASYDIASLIASGDYNESTRTFSVTLPGLRPVKGYYLRARLVSSEGELGEWKDSSTRYVTLPPRAKALGAPKKWKTDSSVRLRWDHPRRCEAEDCVYYVKISNNWKKNKDLMYTGSYIRDNKLTLTTFAVGLVPGKKYRFKVLTCLERDVCHPKYSKWKKFRR